ncbi:methylmalonyl-CoA epimerase [Halalkalibacter oceani]|uniref:methylmalonyl-CoA epimerase n=1 Tax=Halalkalibacter oceani TaxID=1653776 RepID=UPI00339B12B3
MISKINHIAIIVKNIEEALIPYQRALGLDSTEIELVEEFNVRVVFIPVGDTQIELVEPLEENQPLNEFLKKTGGGLHHIALEVGEIEGAIKELEKEGINMDDRVPRPGAHNTKVAFANEKEFNGVIMELVQPSK